MKNRVIELHRATKETDITIALSLHSRGKIEISTGLPFFDHLLYSMAFHGNFSLSIKATGDIDVDPHHLVEDTGLVLGTCFHDVAENNGAIRRYAHENIPMDDSLAQVVIDACGRAYLVYNVDFPQNEAGSFQVWLLREFFNAFTANARINLHINSSYSLNSHHLAEAIFKAFGRGLKTSYSQRQDSDEVLSTKGSM
jgi:imidazoleglycerol-phosphate dehydratase